MVTANTVCLCLSDASLLPLIVASLGAAKVTVRTDVHMHYTSSFYILECLYNSYDSYVHHICVKVDGWMYWSAFHDDGCTQPYSVVLQGNLVIPEPRSMDIFAFCRMLLC